MNRQNIMISWFASNYNLKFASIRVFGSIMVIFLDITQTKILFCFFWTMGYWIYDFNEILKFFITIFAIIDLDFFLLKGVWETNNKCCLSWFRFMPGSTFFYTKRRGSLKDIWLCQVWGSGGRGAMVGFRVIFGNLTNIWI